MKARTILILTVSCLLLAAIGLGIEDIYCAYFLGSSGYKSLYLSMSPAVNGTAVFIGDAVKPKPEYVSALVEWTREQGASTVAYDLNSSGSAVCEFDSRLRSLLIEAGAAEDIPPLDDTMSGVYVCSDPVFVGAFVRDGVFMPGTVGLPVLGYYDRDRMPDRFRALFFYPLTVSRGEIQTVVTDAADVDGLRDIMLSQYEDSTVIEYDSCGGVWGFIKLLFHDRLISRSRTHVFITTIGLALAFVFGGLMLFREKGRELVIRHLNGMSLARIRAAALSTAAAVTAAAMLLFAAALRFTALARLTRDEKLLLAGILLLVSIALDAAVLVFGMARLRKKLNGGIRYEGA